MTPPLEAEYETPEAKARRRRTASPARSHESGAAERRAKGPEERLEALEQEQESVRLALSPQAEAHPRVRAARGESGTREIPRNLRMEGTVPPQRVDVEARRELVSMRVDRRDFLRKSAIGAGILALGAGLGYGSGYAQAAGLAGGTRTVITDSEIAARVIGGVRIATEFIPDPVPAGTDVDPYPGSAIQAALNDGLAVYVPSGTWRLSAAITRPVDNVNLIGAGRSTKLLLDGVTPCISAGSQSGWLIANLATDAGGVDIGTASQSRITEIWVDGALTDNRPRTAAGGGGAGAGYHGVRAADYITSGDGSEGNPWNASAIVDAINALPAGGGTVFVRSGWWSGTRISLGSTGQAGRGKQIKIQGEAADLSHFNVYQASGVGTMIKCGFDINTAGCLVDFYDCILLPQTYATRCLKFLYDTLDQYWGVYRSIGGVHIENCKFMGGHPALWFTGQNITDPNDAAQHWNVLVERCHFRGGGTAIRIEDGNQVNYNGIFRGDIRNIVIQACTAVAGARAVEVNVANLKGVWTNWLIEDSGGAGADYALYIRTARAGAGFAMESIDFGDGGNATDDAYFESSIEGMTVRNLWYGGISGGSKGVDLRGYGDFEVGRYSNAIGNVDVLASGGITIRGRPGLVLGIGTITNPENVLIIRHPGDSTADHIGSSTSGASPYTYTNKDSALECVYLVGGSITDVSRDGQSLGAERVHYLAPGQSVVVTWNTTAPTIRRYRVS